MENKKGLSIVLLIPTIIIGVALYEEFDFESLKFEKPALAVVYFIGLSISIILQFKNFKKRPENNNNREHFVEVMAGKVQNIKVFNPLKLPGGLTRKYQAIRY